MFKIVLVAHKHNVVHFLVVIVVELLDPIVQMMERILVRNIEQDNAAMRSSVVARRNVLETLLPSSIPQL